MMADAVFTLDLAPAASEHRVANLRGRLFYLPDAEAVVEADYPRQGGLWRCNVIARRYSATPGTSRVELASDMLHAASTTVTVSVDDVDGRVMLWQVHVWRRHPYAPYLTVAKVMAHHLRPPGSLYVDLDDETAVRMVMESCRLRPEGLRSVLHRLAAEHLLTSVGTHDAGWGVYHLTIPPAVRSGQ
jgi:hypothetical protein